MKQIAAALIAFGIILVPLLQRQPDCFVFFFFFFLKVVTTNNAEEDASLLIIQPIMEMWKQI